MTNNNSQKGFAMPVIISIVAVVLVLGSVTFYANKSQVEKTKMAEEKAMMEKKAMEQKEKDAMMEKKDGEMMKDDSMIKNDGGAMMEKEDSAMMKKEDGAMMAKYTGTVLAGKSAPLLDYNKADYDAAIASDKLVVLYFYANWCPLCKEELASATYPAFNELMTDKVVGMRINYKDSDTDKDEENLARQYGIAYQHTKVLVKNGKQILKGPDSWDKARYITEINKAIAQ